MNDCCLEDSERNFNSKQTERKKSLSFSVSVEPLADNNKQETCCLKGTGLKKPSSNHNQSKEGSSGSDRNCFKPRLVFHGKIIRLSELVQMLLNLQWNCVLISSL